MRKILVSVCFIGIYISLSSQSIEFDKKIGTEYAAQIEQSLGIYEHESSEEMIKSIGNSLVPNIQERKFDYNFELIDMGMPNAFALPGGYVYVSRGLLALTNSEDELAGVIGHEIGHCEYRHSVKQLRRKIIPALLKLPGAIVSMTVDEHLGQVLNAPLNTSSSFFLASYSRKHEKQADRFGINLMTTADYAPDYFPNILDRLSKTFEELTGEEETFSYFDSHPYTPKRVKYLDAEIKKHQLEGLDPTKKEHDSFLMSLDGLCFGPNPLYGIFQDNEFLHPGLQLHVTFPKGWDTDNETTTFGAADTTGSESMIAIGILPEAKAPELSGTEYVKKIKENFNTTPEVEKSVNINGINGYLVSVRDSSGTEVVGIHSLWFNLFGNSYQFIGIAPDTHFELLKESAKSIRPLNQAELSSIEIMKIRIKKAQKGESLADFCERVDNIINPELTAIINDIDINHELKEGQLVKIISNEKFYE